MQKAVLGLSASVAVLVLAVGCKEEPSASSAHAVAAPALSAVPPASDAALAAPAASGAPLAGLDSCLVGSWKSTVFSLKSGQVSAVGGANVALQINADGNSVVDFGGMAPIQGKGASADFDFQYSGKATGVLSTPTQGTISSTKSDFAGLRVSANVSVPGAGKFPVLKNKAVSELAQMAGAMTADKGLPASRAGSATPPGVDANPLFSTTQYTCAGSTLTLSGKGPEWTFTRAAK